MKLRHLLAVSLAVIFATSPGTQSQAGVPDLAAWTFGSVATRIENSSEWKVNLGAGLGIGADYVGSDDFTAHTLPVVDIEWRGAYFLSTQRGLGLNLIRNRQTKAGPRLTWSAGRKASVNTALAGMGDLDPSIEGGAFIQHYSGPWRFEADLRYGLNSAGHKGFVGSTSLALGGQLSENSNMILGASTTYGSSAYMKAHFGVTTAQAVNGRVAYEPTAGFENFAGFATFIYNINKQIYLTIDGRAALMMDQAANSPLVQASDQYFLGSTVGYRF